jgi:Tol biopolymer transport system component
VRGHWSALALPLTVLAALGPAACGEPALDGAATDGAGDADHPAPELLNRVTNAYPAYSPDGRRIAYMSTADGDFDIYVVQPSAGVRVKLTDTDAREGTPAWSPDGSRIAFQSFRDGRSQVYVMNADGTGQRSVSNGEWHDEHPSWSADGERLLFASNRSATVEAPDNFDIFEMRLDGSGVRQITNTPEVETYPSWSPAGDRIAVRKIMPDGNWEVVVMRADGTNPRVVAPDPAAEGWPVWSPDGRRLVFSSERAGTADLWLIDLETDELRRLTWDDDADERQPWFSPDGGRVAYARYQWFRGQPFYEASDIFVVKVRPLLGQVAMETDDLVIVDVNVLPMTDDTVLLNHSVLVRDGRIVAVVPTEQSAVPAGARVLDAEGRYLLPGLVDFHVHLRAESELDAYLRYGVTTIVNMRGTPELLETREALRRGVLTGPRLFTAGPLLDGDPPIWNDDGTRVVTTPAEARTVVAEHVRAGYDLVKVYNNLDPDVLTAVDEAAREAGLAVVGHLPRRPARSEGLRRGLDAGIDLIAHGEEVFFTHLGGAPDSLVRSGAYAPPTDDEIRQAAELIALRGVAVTPNLSFVAMTARMLSDIDAVFTDPEFERLASATREMWREENPTRRPDLEAFTARERVKFDVVRRLTAALHEAGVTLLVGTDASAPGMYPGRSVHVELAELREAGLDSYAVLAAATRNAGDFLAEHVAGAPAIGRIAPGYAADFLVVEEDPRDDLGTLARPWRVFRGGWTVLDGSREW